MLEIYLNEMGRRNRDGAIKGRANELYFSGCSYAYEGLKALIVDSQSKSGLPYSSYLKEKIRLIEGGLRDLKNLVAIVEELEKG